MHHAATMRPVHRIGDLLRVLQSQIERQRTFLQATMRVSPFQMLHHHEVDAVLLADIEEDADVRMIQRRDGTRLTLEPLPEVFASAMCDGSTFTATVRLSRVSRALYTSPMPPAPIGRRIS